MSWQADVVNHLCHYKAQGLSFEAAWLQAMIDAPPRGRDLGPERPTLWTDGEPSLVAFFHRACEDAWFGRQPALMHFHPSLLIERDGSAPAMRQRKLAA